eukprot:4572878-Pleurochrysis_carterae.AAC.1
MSTVRSAIALSRSSCVYGSALATGWSAATRQRQRARAPKASSIAPSREMSSTSPKALSLRPPLDASRDPESRICMFGTSGCSIVRQSIGASQHASVSKMASSMLASTQGSARPHNSPSGPTAAAAADTAAAMSALGAISAMVGSLALSAWRSRRSSGSLCVLGKRSIVSRRSRVVLPEWGAPTSTHVGPSQERSSAGTSSLRTAARSALFAPSAARVSALALERRLRKRPVGTSQERGCARASMSLMLSTLSPLSTVVVSDCSCRHDWLCCASLSSLSSAS